MTRSPPRAAAALGSTHLAPWSSAEPLCSASSPGSTLPKQESRLRERFHTYPGCFRATAKYELGIRGRVLKSDHGVMRVRVQWKPDCGTHLTSKQRNHAAVVRNGVETGIQRFSEGFLFLFLRYLSFVTEN